ncbi:MAG: hypothetical protein M3N26_06795 [Pseudomonadota bacterium]|nr:hypothetical protein [Pseudomonadota bacterium]
MVTTHVIIDKDRAERAAEHLRAMMSAMYEGKSIRTPKEFREDLTALHAASDIMSIIAEGKTLCPR